MLRAGKLCAHPYIKCLGHNSIVRASCVGPTPASPNWRPLLRVLTGFCRASSKISLTRFGNRDTIRVKYHSIDPAYRVLLRAGSFLPAPRCQWSAHG